MSADSPIGRKLLQWNTNGVKTAEKEYDQDPREAWKQLGIGH